jgi:hypothetical protein
MLLPVISTRCMRGIASFAPAPDLRCRRHHTYQRNHVRQFLDLHGLSLWLMPAIYRVWRLAASSRRAVPPSQISRSTVSHIQ